MIHPLTMVKSRQHLYACEFLMCLQEEKNDYVGIDIALKFHSRPSKDAQCRDVLNLPQEKREIHDSSVDNGRIERGTFVCFGVGTYKYLFRQEGADRHICTHTSSSENMRSTYRTRACCPQYDLE